MDALQLTKRNSNDATQLNPFTVNGSGVDIHQTVRGSDLYFAICSIMGLVGLTIVGLSFMKPRSDRIFFYITAAINLTAAIAYFSMGSNLGWTSIGVEFFRSNPVVHGSTRQIFYARYIDWVVTTPLLLMDLMLTAAMPWPTVLWTIFLDEVMIITGLLGALVVSRFKWGYFVIGCVAMLGIFYQLGVEGSKHSRALGSDVFRVYMMCGVLTLFIWCLYPIAWGLCEGGNVISPDSEAVFYGILDCIAKPVFSAALIYGHWGIPPDRMGLRIREMGSTGPGFEAEKKYTGDVEGANSSARVDGFGGVNGYTNGNTNGNSHNDNTSRGYADKDVQPEPVQPEPIQPEPVQSQPRATPNALTVHDITSVRAGEGQHHYEV